MKVKCIWSSDPHWFKQGGEYDAKRASDALLIRQDELVSDLWDGDAWRARACRCGILEVEHFTIPELAVFVEAAEHES